MKRSYLYLPILACFIQLLLFIPVANATNSNIMAHRESKDEPRLPREDVRFNGLYLSANIGRQMTLTNVSSALNVVVPGIVNVTLPINSDENDPSLLLGASLGYAALLHDRYYIAIEGRFDSQSLSPSGGIDIHSEDNQSIFSANTELSLNQSYILAIKPGFKVSSHTLFYGMLGTSLARFTINTTGNYFQDVGFGLHSGSISDTQHLNKLGFLIGIGVEQYLSNNISVKLEGDYIAYGKIISNEVVTGPVAGTTANSTITMNNYSMKVDMYKILVGLAYHFG